MQYDFKTIQVSRLEFNGGQVKGLPANPRTITDGELTLLKKNITDYPDMLTLRGLMVYPLSEDRYVVIGGNMRLKAIRELGYSEAPCIIISKDTPAEKLKAYAALDNNNFGEWDYNMLNEDWDTSQLSSWGIELPDFNSMVKDEDNKEKPKKLSDRFIIPPLSILRTSKKEWRDRKRYWLNLGIKSGEGRDENLTYSIGRQPINVCDKKKKYEKEIGRKVSWEEYAKEFKIIPYTSIFDPVLCELAYTWFVPEGGKVLDPFCGGSVRGIVAKKCGHDYFGLDIRQEQIDENIQNGREVLGDNLPSWVCGDSRDILEYYKEEADLIFSCPPYADLEVYSDDERDLSNKSYGEFIELYREIITKACKRLKDNRFAVFVVSEVRGKKGEYYNFVGDTIKAFIDAGLVYYNELILATQVASAAIAAGNLINASRKIARVHQNVLVFYKGDMKKIKENFKPIDMSYIEDVTKNEEDNI